MQTREQWAESEARLALQRLPTGTDDRSCSAPETRVQVSVHAPATSFSKFCALYKVLLLAGRKARPSACSFASSREHVGFRQARDARAHDCDLSQAGAVGLQALMITFRNDISFSVYVIGQARTRQAAPTLKLSSQFSIPKGPALNISNDISHHLRVSRSLLNSNAARSYWRCASAVQREMAFYCNMPAARVSAASHSCHSW